MNIKIKNIFVHMLISFNIEYNLKVYSLIFLEFSYLKNSKPEIFNFKYCFNFSFAFGSFKCCQEMLDRENCKQTFLTFIYFSHAINSSSLCVALIFVRDDMVCFAVVKLKQIFK